MSDWAIDLGTTNTVVSLWEKSESRPRVLDIAEITRKPDGSNDLEAPSVVPSATHLVEDDSFWTGIFRKPWLIKHTFVGRYAHIGQPALEMNRRTQHPHFVPCFKPSLMRSPTKPLTRIGKRSYDAREVTKIFLRELFAAIKGQEGERIRNLVFTTPVDAYELYRAELGRIARSLGVKELHFIDEPVAAALGYGIGLEKERKVLVVDFGGGTLDVAFVSFGGRDARKGRCNVIAKDGKPIGGNLVDRWLLDNVLHELDVEVKEDAFDWERGFWHRLALNEARRVKEALYSHEKVTFTLTPPERMRGIEGQISGAAHPVEITRNGFGDILTRAGLYSELEDCLDNVFEQASREGFSESSIDEVLVVGGSTLLQGVQPLLTNRFGRNKVRNYHPFEAVGYGAAAYASGHFTQSDYIVHDYAILHHHPQTHEPDYRVVVPKGTRFPSDKALWRQHMTPTCSLGEPETSFKLVICEVGVDHGTERRFTWNANGELEMLGGASQSEATRFAVPLNEANPTLGTLDPPHAPSDKKARLDISFGLNEDRWLVATIRDLKTGRQLMDSKPVCKLL